MTETAFLQYTGYVLAFFAVWIVARCARSMLSERYVPEVWGYLELPDGTSRAIEHWECILGRAKASDIVLTGEGIERSHAAIQRSGAGEWTLSALDGGRGVWLNGKAVTGDAPLRGGDTLKLGEMELHFLALDDAQRATLQRKRPLTGHKVQPAVTLLLLVCFQLVLLFQFFFTTDGAALAYIVLSFGLLIAMEWFCYFVMRSISVRGFEPETLAFFLTSVGFSVAGSSAPDGMGRHCLLFLAALALFFALGVWLRDLHRVRAMRWPMAFAALGFLALNLLLSETIWGAKNWLSIAGQTLQPSEFVKIAYVYAGAATLDRLFRRRNLILFIAFSAVCVGALALMGDFGTALVFFVCFLVISFMRSGSFATLFLAIGGAALAVMLVLTVKPYVAQRFATWAMRGRILSTPAFSRCAPCPRRPQAVSLAAARERAGSKTYSPRTPTWCSASCARSWGSSSRCAACSRCCCSRCSPCAARRPGALPITSSHPAPRSRSSWRSSRSMCSVRSICCRSRA